MFFRYFICVAIAFMATTCVHGVKKNTASYIGCEAVMTLLKYTSENQRFEVVRDHCISHCILDLREDVNIQPSKTIGCVQNYINANS